MNKRTLLLLLIGIILVTSSVLTIKQFGLAKTIGNYISSSFYQGVPNNQKTAKSEQKKEIAQGNVLGVSEDFFRNFEQINFNLPAFFNDYVNIDNELTVGGNTTLEKDATISGNLVVEKNVTIRGQRINFGTAIVTGGNLINAISAGTGIAVTTGTSPVITNSGVLSLQGSTGAVKLEEGDNITIDGLKISAKDTGKDLDIFKTFSVSGQSDIVADSNTDTFTFAQGTGITLTTDATNKKLTIASTGLSGWTADTGKVYLQTISDSVGIGTTTPSTKLDVVGAATISSNVSIGGNLNLNGDSISDLSGNGLAVSSNALGVNLTTSGTTGAISSNSGLEVSSSGLSLLKGCATGEVLKWNESLSLWECSTDVGSSATGIINVKENDVIVSSSAGTLDFLGADFALVESPSGEINVSLDYTNSGITRKSVAETITGAWAFSNGLSVSSGINNNAGGITNAGAISGGTAITSSGAITFSGLGTGIVHANSSGVLSSTALNLAGGSSEVTGTLPQGNGGTGFSTYTTGDILYASAANTLSKRTIGSTGQILTVVGGLPVWSNISGDSCINCLIDNPSLSQSITPSVGTATGLSIAQASGGSVDVFNVTDYAGTTKFLQVNSSGNVSLSGNLAVTGTTTLTGNVIGSASPTLSGFGTINGATLSGGSLSGGSYSDTGVVATGNYRTTIADGGNFSVYDGTQNIFTVTDGGSTGNITNIGSITANGTISGLTGITSSGTVTFSGLSSGITSSGVCLNASNNLITCTYGGGTMSSFTAAGDSGSSQTISDANTLSILGGTNGIDTVASATDTITLNLDTTEIGTTTFGSGSAVTWTFDASAGTDPTIAFGNNAITFTASTPTFTGGIVAPTSSNTINSLIINAGALSGVTGYSQASGAFTVNGSGAVALGTGTNNVTIGNGTGTFALTSSGGLNVTTGGALTGVASIDTISTSATSIGFAGAGTITSTSTSALTLDSGTTGTVNVGTGNNAKTVNIATGTAGNTVNIGTDNTVADAINVGSALDTTTITGTTNILGATSINSSGSLATNIGTGTSTGTITIGRTTGTDLALNDANWNITGAGAANFASIGAVTPGTGAFTTLSSTGATTLGNNSATVAINSSSWDVSSAGVASGLTGISSSGTITFSGLTSGSTSSGVCLDASNNLITCTYGGGTMSSFTAAGDSGTPQTIANGNTLSVLGGTNGIDTVASATGNLTLNLDSTEIGTTTFGSGSGVTWTFDASAGTDPSIAFGNDSVTITTGTTNLTGALQTGGTQRLSNAGVLGNITGFTQTSGTFASTVTTTNSAVFSSSTANSDSIAIKPQSTTATNSFTGTISSDDLTAARTWLFPDRAGTVSLSGDTFTTDVTGTLSATGATALTIAADAVALGTDTTGNYIATITGDSQIGVSGSGSESAGVALSINSNSLDASHLAASLVFADADLINLSGITQSSAVNEGLILPSLSNTSNLPASGKGYLAYDTVADKVRVYNGSSWADISGSTSSFSLTGSDTGTTQSIGDGDTLTIAAGYGIDTTASNTDTLTVALDPTEVGTTTFGAGSDFTWTFNGSGATDPSIAFGNNALTFTANSATFTGAITAPTSSNTINSLIINAGALSGITGYSQSSGTFTVNGSGAVALGTGTNNVTIGNGTGTFALTSSGGLNVTTGGALTGVASIDTISTSATSIGFAGAGTITSTSTSALTLDSGTTGTVNLGTGNNAKTINVGTGTAGNTINVGTDNTVADSIGIGSALDTVTIFGTTGITGATTINGSGSLATNIGTGTSTGTITIGRTAGTDLALNDANWNITGAGAANFASIGAVTPGTGAFTTLSSTGATTLGNNSSTVAINSSSWDVSSAGVASGLTGISSSGTITFSGLSSGSTSSGVCLDASNNLITCTYGGGAMSSFTAAADSGSSQTISNASTLSVLGGANGIDTVASATGNITLNLDTTEIGTTTFGSGSAVTWTFDASAGTDPTIAFGNDTITTTVGTLTQTGAFSVTGNTTLNGNVTVGDATTDRVTFNSQILNSTGNTFLVLQGATDNSFTTTFNISDPSANRTITVPNNSGTMTLNTSGSATGGTSAYVQGGQTWATTATLGTSDTNALNIITDGTTRLSIASSGTSTFSATTAANSGSTQNIASVTYTSPVDTVGTNISQGLNITPTISNATGGTNTANIFNIGAVTGDAEVTLNAVKIGALTGTGATETALNIGSGWDSVLSVNGTSVINGSGQLVASQLNGTLFSTSADSGSSTIIQGDTLALNGGTNGIDTTLTGDTYTLNLDTTEIGTTTFGSGSGVTWTFDASAGTDPTIAFGNNAITFTASTPTFTGGIAAPTSSNTINSLIINAGALSGITGYSQASGAFTVNGSGAVALGTGTNNVTVGNGTGTFALTSSGGLNVTTGGALTGVASIDTISTSATSIGFAGAGTITSTSTSALTLDSGTTGTVNIATGNNAKTINVGTGNAGNTVNIGTDNTVADTIGIGSALDTVSVAGTTSILGATTINGSGSLATNIGTGTSTGTITIGRTTGTDLALNDANWNITGAGAANFASIGAVTPGTGAFTTLSSTGATTLGNNSSTVAIDTTSWDVSTAGIFSGLTGLTSSGTIAFTGLSSGVTSSGLCINASNQLITCAAGGGSMSSFTAAGDSGSSQTISDANTLSILGGTNGIDTVASATDTLTLNLDTTEIGTTTFGSGSGTTWTFDASAGTDTTIAFGNNTQTFTTGTATFSGDVTAQGTTGMTLSGTGAGVTISGTGNHTISTTNAGSNLTVGTTTTGALTLDSGTTGAVNLGTGSNAKTVTIGNTTGASAVTVNSGTGAQSFNSSVATGSTTTSAFAFNANSLTTGTGLYVGSTGTGLTSGSLFQVGSTANFTAFTGALANIDWSPSSTTTGTGDLFALNIGANGNLGNIFNVKDSGSSVFSVSETAITANLPASFNAPGDVSMAYDLAFTNQTASTIKSNAPLSIEAGESFESNNLTLKTYNSGNLVLDIGSSAIVTPSGNLTLQPGGAGTTANVQIGAGGAGSTTPDYFALDVKSTTGDPSSGAEGYMYYNTFDNKFRCYQGSAWADCITSGGGTMSSFTAAGDSGSSQTISDANTLSILGGTNGIDTVASATDTLTLNLDTTEIGTTTFGSGSDFTWTFNGSGSTDPTIAFGSNSITTSGLTTLTRTLGADSATTQNVGSVTFTSPADTTGTNVNQGLNITPTIGNATGGTNTANIFNIGAVTGDAEVTLNAVKIGALTGTSATETALNIGSGWDSVLSVNGTSVINGSGQVVTTQLNGTLFSTNSDSASPNTIIQGDTLAINGTATGIDVTHSGDTMTVALDTTEITNTTFGSGSGYTWTFDAGATDPTIAFASNQITIGSAATLTATGVTTLDCTDCINFDDIADSTSLDAAMTLAQGTNTWTQTFTGTSTTGHTYTANSVDTGVANQINTTALTSGTSLAIAGGGANMATNGELIDLAMGAATAGNGINISTTGAYTGTGLGVLTANSLSTGTLLSLASSGSSQTSAKYIDVAQTGVTTGFTGNLLNLASSSTTGAANFINLTANSSTLGVGENISMTGLTGGTGLKITGGGSNMISTGKMIDLNMGAAVQGFGLNITTTGAYQGASAGLIYATANALTGGTMEVLTGSSSTLYGTGQSISLSSTSSSTLTTLTGSNITISDTGAVASLFDTTYGQNISVTRTGAVGGTITNYGSYITLTSDTGGTSAGYGVNVTSSNADTTYGISTIAQNTAAATVGTAYGLYSQVSNTNASGTLTNGYGVYVDTPSNSGTFTNNYGLYLNDQSSVGSTLSYNLYSAGATAKNYFQGLVGIGDAAPSGTRLSLGANTTALSSLRLTASSAVNVSSPAIGDVWFNGTNLNFRKDGSTTVDLLAAGSGMTSFTAAGDSGSSQTISNADTLSIVGGTNGIDTVASATDTLTLNLDTTEIGTTTFGSGSGYTWTFDAGATDPTIAFASNQITIGSAATLTATGVTTLDCTDCINFDDIADSTSLDAAMTLAQGTNTWTQTFTGTSTTGHTYTANSVDTGVANQINTTALTSGTSLAIAGGGANMATNGELVDLAMGAATAGNGINISTTGSYTGTGLGVLTANSLTTGKMFGINSSATSGITTAGTNVGSMFDITESGAMSAFTGSLASINASGANTSGSTGNLLNLNIAGTGQLMKGIKFTDATTGNLGTTAGASGANLFSMTGDHTGYGMQISDVTTAGTALALNVNSMTTGTGLNLASTSTALTTGRLLNLDWSPASTTTATGDLFRINIGSSGNIGNLFNVTDNASSIFSVAENQITSSVPHQFTAAGDVGIAYDLQFTNQTASYIKSNAPLTLDVGESFESNDLTLQTYNSGDINLDTGATGAISLLNAVNFGAAQTFTAADTTPDVSGGSHFVTAGTATITDFDAGTSGTLHAGQLIFVECATAVTFDVTSSGLIGGAADLVCGSGDMTTWLYDGTDWRLVAWMDQTDTQTGADLAEWYASNEALTPGDVVSIDKSYPDEAYIKKSASNRDATTIGIVSTKPGKTLGEPVNGKAYAIALAGRVPVKVSTTNGPIEKGDYLTTSNTPGVATKATVAGPTIGKALTSYSGSGTGEVIVFVNVSWYDPDAYLASLSEVNISQNSNSDKFSLSNAGNLISRIGMFSDVAAGNMSTGFIDAKKISLDGTNIMDLINSKTPQTAQASATVTQEDLNSILSSGYHLETTSDALSITKKMIAYANVNIQGDLQVLGQTFIKGKATFEDETIFNKLVTFVSNTIFKGNVSFEDHVAFNKDTAGIAIIEKNSDTVTINFDKEYASVPLVSATMVHEGEATSSAFLKTFYVTEKTNKGFKIKLDSAQTEDVSFNWIAIAVSDPKISKSSDATPAPSVDPIVQEGVDKLMKEATKSAQIQVATQSAQANTQIIP